MEQKIVNRIKQKLLYLVALLNIFILLLPSWTSIFGEVYALATGPGSITPGTGWRVSDSTTPFTQYGATFECEDVNWGSGTQQRTVYEEWVKQGKQAENNWAYMEAGGDNRYLVALSQEFGWPGDYVDIVINKDGVETTYPCIIGDAKGNNEEEPMGKPIPDDKGNIINRGAYLDSSKFQWGHLHATEDDCCNILEIMSKDNNVTSEFSAFLASVKEVSGIQNGGSWIEHPEGPIGLDGNYLNSAKGKGNFDTDTIIGTIGGTFREIWISITTLFDTRKSKKE